MGVETVNWLHGNGHRSWYHLLGPLEATAGADATGEDAGEDHEDDAHEQEGPPGTDGQATRLAGCDTIAGSGEGGSGHLVGHHPKRAGIGIIVSLGAAVHDVGARAFTRGLARAGTHAEGDTPEENSQDGASEGGPDPNHGASACWFCASFTHFVDL